MHRNPMDMFEEMDEMFARLFTRMNRDFMDSSHPGYGHRIAITGHGDEPESGEPADDAGSPALVTGETAAEIHHIGDEVKVIADLPGITEDALRLGVKGNLLVIDAGDADHHYHTTAALPPVDAASMQKTLKNGVLEVTFRSMPGSGKE